MTETANYSNAELRIRIGDLVGFDFRERLKNSALDGPGAVFFTRDQIELIYREVCGSPSRYKYVRGMRREICKEVGIEVVDTKWNTTTTLRAIYLYLKEVTSDATNKT